MNADLLISVRSILETTSTRWSALASLPDQMLIRRPAPEEWSALECLQHLIEAESVFGFRLQAFLTDQNFPAYTPATQKDKVHSATVLAAELRCLRSANIGLLVQVGPQDLTRCVHHAELGLVTLAEMLNEWAAHDLMHTVQAERALMQPFIAGSGPWQVYFQDHVQAQPSLA